MYEIVKEYLENIKEPVPKEDLETLYELLEYKPMREKDRLKFTLISDIIVRLKTDHERLKNLCLYRSDKIVTHCVEDKTKSLSKRQLSALSDVLRRIFNHKSIYCTGISFEQYIKIKESLDHIDMKSLISMINDFDNESFDRGRYQVVLELIEDIEYNNFNMSSLAGSGADVPLSEGTWFPLIVPLLTLWLNIRTSRCIIFKQGSANQYICKLSKLLAHIHLSGGDSVPVPHFFLEDNGYEPLTKCIMLDTLTDKTYSSLHILEGLGLAEVSTYDKEKGKSREITLTLLGKSVGAVLGLTNKRVSLRELSFKEGDLTANKKDYKYYIDEGWIPDYTVINPFLKVLESSTINITKYLDSFAEEYPIIEYELEEYLDYIKDNIRIINEGVDTNVKVLANYSTDILNLTSGLSIERKYKKLGKNGINGRELVVSFTNVWRLSYTGRLFQRCGLQGISRESKAILHSNSYNYDIPTSQLMVLKQLLEEVYTRYKDDFTGQDLSMYSEITWLDNYINNKSFKERLITSTGTAETDWKVCVYSIVFGSSLFNIYNNSVINVIVSRNRLNPDFNLPNFYEALKPLDDLVQLWLKYINRYLEDYVVPLSAQAKINMLEMMYDLDLIDMSKYIYNGVVFLQKDSKTIRNKKHLSAFLLQGIEASFILNLSLMVREGVVSYEFDGLVTPEEIPLEYIEEARKRSGFKYGNVVVKSFK